jgi:hypothetical protein
LRLLEGDNLGMLVMMAVVMMLGIALTLALNLFLPSTTAHFEYDLGSILAGVFGGGGVMVAALAYARNVAPKSAVRPPDDDSQQALPPGSEATGRD